jgi:hypothetical protein
MTRRESLRRKPSLDILSPKLRSSLPFLYPSLVGSVTPAAAAPAFELAGTLVLPTSGE